MKRKPKPCKQCMEGNNGKCAIDEIFECLYDDTDDYSTAYIKELFFQNLPTPKISQSTDKTDDD